MAPAGWHALTEGILPRPSWPRVQHQQGGMLRRMALPSTTMALPMSATDVHHGAGALPPTINESMPFQCPTQVPVVVSTARHCLAPNVLRPLSNGHQHLNFLFPYFCSVILVKHGIFSSRLVWSAAFCRKWHDYNTNFRLMQAPVPSRSWVTIDAEL